MLENVPLSQFFNVLPEAFEEFWVSQVDHILNKSVILDVSLDLRF